MIYPTLKPTGRYSYGRGVIPMAQAFVIHCIPLSGEVYANTLCEPITKGAQANYPQSVHFLINYDGQITQFATVANTVPGFDKFEEPTWPALPDIPYQDINEPFLHIGFVGDSLTLDSRRSLIEILSQYGHELRIPLDRLHVLSPNDLDVTRCCPTDIPEALLVEARTKSKRSGHVIIPDVVEMGKSLNTLHTKSNDIWQRLCGNTALLETLQEQIAAINEQIDGLDVSGIQDEIDALKAKDEVLTNQLIEFGKVLAEHQECIDCVCGTKEVECIHYKLLPSQGQTLVPDSPLWLNLPTQIEDSDPPKVLSGPLWSVCLGEECTWTIEASATLQLAEYCAGRYVRLELVACGETYLIDEFVSQGGSAAVALSGSTVLVTPPTCNDTHLQITTNDDTQAFKIVNTADFKACCS